VWGSYQGRCHPFVTVDHGGAFSAALASVVMRDGSVTVVLPCLNEAASLPGVLAAMPPGYRPLVVDNNSTDGTAEVARDLGADVVAERRPGYGSAVHAGVEAATTPIVAVVDADGSLDPGELPTLVDELDRGADMAIGRRRPVPGLRWPWHARLGTAAVCWRIRSKYGLPVHDIAPMRVARRDALLGLGITDRRTGYPVELMVRAAKAGWTVVERDVPYGPRTGGKSKVSGSLRGSVYAGLDFWRAIS
jgi:glycosyltransferase involved in cell wall biosynthesis